MPAFSRGSIRILSHPLFDTTHLLTSTLRSKPPSRFFSTNPILNASKKPNKGVPTKPSHPPPSKTTPSLTKSTPPRTTIVQTPSQNRIRTPTTTTLLSPTFARTLSLKPTPTLIYTSPSQTLYTLISYTTTLFCFSYAGLNYYNIILYPPPDTPFWIPYAYTGICFFMISLGTYVSLGPQRVVRKIFAVKVKPRIGGGEKKFSGMVKGKDEKRGILDLEIHLNSSIPFLKPKIITSPINSISISQPLTPLLISSLTPAEIAAQKAYTAAAKLKWERNILSRGIQEIRHHARRFWMAVRKVLIREGFVKVGVRDKGTWNLDVSGGWVLQDGGVGGLDRLCEVREPESWVKKWFWKGKS